MLENSERSVRGVRMEKSGPLERAELANQIQGFRIPDRWDASEKNKYGLLTNNDIKMAGNFTMMESMLTNLQEKNNIQYSAFDQTSLVHKGFIIYKKNAFFFAGNSW